MDKQQFNKIKLLVQDYLEPRGIKIKDVILFGSSVNMDISEANDIDIMIISEKFEDKTIFERSAMTRGLHEKLIKECNKPFDILYLTQEECKDKELVYLH
ncbi:nucleotidyltransferase domain-containing protein [candidate division WOR-3 bacterium]|nr:nucleotidyltransferase domain-containing protein [candidate division WOR-3 bacterium]